MSLQKLLVLVLVIAAVWYGFKWVGRLERERKARLKASARGGAPAGRDLVQCTLCGTYVPTDLDRCPEERSDCPSVKG